MLQWSLSSLPPASLHPMEMFHWKLKAFQSIVLVPSLISKQISWPFLHNYHVSQPTKTKAIISHILKRKTEEGNERERERENVRARSWSKHLLGGRCPGEEALRPLLCLVLLPLIWMFLPGPSPRIYFEGHISIDPLFNAIAPQNRLKPFAICISWFHSLSHPTPADKRHEGEHKIAQDWQDWQQQRSASGSSDVACCQRNSSDA